MPARLGRDECAREPARGPSDYPFLPIDPRVGRFWARSESERTSFAKGSGMVGGHRDGNSKATLPATTAVRMYLAIASRVKVPVSSSFAVTHRNRERERRTHPELALHPDPAPVQLDELPTEGQPQPGALHLLLRPPHLPELLEHRLLILRRDTDAGVADRDLDQPVLWHCSDLDPPILRCELDRVR